MSKITFNSIRKYFTRTVDREGREVFQIFRPKKGFEIRHCNRVIAELGTNSEEQRDIGRLNMFVYYASDPEGDHGIIQEDRPASLSVFEVVHKRII